MKQRHILLVLLASLALITFLDRLCIAVAGPRMQDELGIPPDLWGWVLGAFILSYALFEIPTGALGDRIGQRRVLTRIVLWWSAFTGLTGAASGFYPLAAVRFLFGIGEAGAYPNISGVISRWFPVLERARAQGYVWSASRIGGALAPVLVVPLMGAFGWRATFWVFGAVGCLWCVFWRLWFRDDPAEHPRMTQEELREIGRPDVLSRQTPWRAMFRSRQLRLVVMMYGSYAWGSWFYFSWLPTYLTKGRGFSEGEMAVFSMLPFLLGATGSLAGGYLSDLACGKLGLRRGRRLVGAGSLSTAACLVAATGLTSNKTTAVVLLSVGFGVMDLMLPSAWAICLDIGGRHAGAVTGAMNTAGNLGGFLCTVIFGYIVDRFQSYELPLFMIAAMLLFSAVIFSRIDPSESMLPAEAS